MTRWARWCLAICAGCWAYIEFVSTDGDVGV